MALINDLIKDTKTLMQNEGETTASLSEKLDLLKPSVSRTINSGRVCDGWINIIEILGYDVKITYVKRQKSASEILKK